MEIAAVTNTEPAPEQFTAKRGKTRSWERGIVYDPDKESLKIRKIKKIERGKQWCTSTEIVACTLLTCYIDSSTNYMSCALPSSSIVNVFVNSKNPKSYQVVTTGIVEEEGIVFLGRLNLQKLGLRDQFSRFCGQLRTLYIVTSTTSIPDKNARD